MKPNLKTFPKIAAVNTFSQNSQFAGQTVCPACLKMMKWKQGFERELRQRRDALRTFPTQDMMEEAVKEKLLSLIDELLGDASK